HAKTIGPEPRLSRRGRSLGGAGGSRRGEEGDQAAAEGYRGVNRRGRQEESSAPGPGRQKDRELLQGSHGETRGRQNVQNRHGEQGDRQLSGAGRSLWQTAGLR